MVKEDEYFMSCKIPCDMIIKEDDKERENMKHDDKVRSIYEALMACDMNDDK